MMRIVGKYNCGIHNRLLQDVKMNANILFFLIYLRYHKAVTNINTERFTAHKTATRSGAEL